FAGSQSRARAGMAQATLTLDNSDGWLPIDYTEVEISRRAFRSGENEYLINGQKMRLRDVQDLLATSGLAERTYTIIGQGLIDQALSLRAEERRALFEEAAGVSHYQARRAETLRRLQETQRNLERVHDILSEIRPRLGALKRQASRARNYEQVETDLRQLLRVWYGYQWDRKREVPRQQRQAAAEAETSWKAERKRMAEQQDEIDRMRRSISQLQDEISHDRTAREELREQREGIQRQVAVLSERRASLQRQVDDIKADLPRLEEQRNHAQEELATATNDLDKAQVQLREQQEELKQFNQSFEATQAEIDRWNSTIQDLEQAQRNSSRKLSQAEGQLTQLRERLQEREKQADSTGNGSLQVASEQVTVLEQRVSEAQ